MKVANSLDFFNLPKIMFIFRRLIFIESGKKKSSKRRNDTEKVFEFGSPSARFMDEDSEVFEEEEEDEETDDNNFKNEMID